MSTFEIKYLPGATPLDPDEKAGLIPNYISTQGELNTLEQENILDAMNWVGAKKTLDILSIPTLYDLHKRMFGRVWKWAGKPRQSNKNIGVMWEQVPTELGLLLENAKYWINNSTYPWEELAVRFHHKLVWIHPFPNGNGRFSRIVTDILLEKNGQASFTWGQKTSQSPIETEGALRDEYLAALREADAKKITRLINFAKS
jgi:Fic-DOC domain mobile mystery protein B